MVRGGRARQPVRMNPNPPRLTRSTSDTMIGGVAGGLGRYFGVDPVLVRVGFVLGALVSGGVVALGYLALLAVVPRDVDGPTPAAPPAAA
jgi:phage shock protein PspC (stress-responsive transcriptional regulator)